MKNEIITMNNNQNRYQGKVILIFGGSKGIGRTIAESFTKEGGDVIISDVDEENGKKVVECAQSQGRKINFIKADVISESEVQQTVFKTITEFKKIDVLVYNVRGPRDKTENLLNHSLSQWMDSLKYVLGGSYLTCKLVIPEMIKQNGGVIINIASISGLYIGDEPASYHTAKAALLNFSKYLADKYGPNNIRINCVSPGFIVNEEHLPYFNAEQNKNYRNTALLAHPLRKVGNAANIANAVLFLASADASFITGQNIIIDGGLTLRDQWSVANQIRSNFEK